MKDSQTKKILGFYDENAEFVRNDRYSDSSQTVYTRPDDKYHWLVAKPQGKNRLEVHQSDEHGVITARDTYESQKNAFKCVDVERLQADGKHRVHFSEDEVNLVYQYGEGGKDTMLAMLNQILPRIKDPILKDIVTQTADKVSSLAPEVCASLISSVKNRKIYERDCSIRERLAKAKAQSKQSVTSEQKKTVSRRGEQSL
jgi:hypothetical protein